MKRSIAVLSATLFFTFGATSQIVIEKHDREVEASIETATTVAAPKATSDCGEVSFTTKDRVFSGGCAGNLVREYTFTDECGNTASTTQFIKLIDTTPPVFNAEKSIIVGADGSNIPESIEVSDNSGFKVTPEYTDKRKKDHIVRTWTATDGCGNSASFEQLLQLKEDI